MEPDKYLAALGLLFFCKMSSFNIKIYIIYFLYHFLIQYLKKTFLKSHIIISRIFYLNFGHHQVFALKPTSVIALAEFLDFRNHRTYKNWE